MKNKFTSRDSLARKTSRSRRNRRSQTSRQRCRALARDDAHPHAKPRRRADSEIPRGKLVTVSALRRALAADFETDVTCPLTTGIFVRIVAEAAEEDRASGRKQLTPTGRCKRRRQPQPKSSQAAPSGKSAFCLQRLRVSFIAASRPR